MTTSTSYPRNGAAPATPPSPSGPSSATWAVHEAPTSCSYALAHRHDGDDLYDARRR